MPIWLHVYFISYLANLENSNHVKSILNYSYAVEHMYWVFYMKKVYNEK